MRRHGLLRLRLLRLQWQQQQRWRQQCLLLPLLQRRLRLVLRLVLRLLRLPVYQIEEVVEAHRQLDACAIAAMATVHDDICFNELMRPDLRRSECRGRMGEAVALAAVSRPCLPSKACAVPHLVPPVLALELGLGLEEAMFGQEASGLDRAASGE